MWIVGRGVLLQLETNILINKFYLSSNKMFKYFLFTFFIRHFICLNLIIISIRANFIFLIYLNFIKFRNVLAVSVVWAGLIHDPLSPRSAQEFRQLESGGKITQNQRMIIRARGQDTNLWATISPIIWWYFPDPASSGEKNSRILSQNQACITWQAGRNSGKELLN